MFRHIDHFELIFVKSKMSVLRLIFFGHGYLIALLPLIESTILLLLNCLCSFVINGFHCSSACKESACKAGDLDLTPELGRSLEKGNNHPLQYSGLENSLDCISMESQRVGHDRETFTFTVAPLSKINWLYLCKKIIFWELKCLKLR